MLGQQALLSAEDESGATWVRNKGAAIEISQTVGGNTGEQMIGIQN